jgi:SAM-dependent methyltransferase
MNDLMSGGLTVSGSTSRCAAPDCGRATRRWTSLVALATCLPAWRNRSDRPSCTAHGRQSRDARGRPAATCDRGIVGNTHSLQANAECLPFRDGSFHCVTIGFGLRNCTDKPAALRSMARVTRPGGRVMVLEFSKPLKALEPFYDLYSFKILPTLGDLVAKDAASYRYLAESIRMHPDQETLRDLMQEAGLEDVRYHNLSGGIVALHIGYRY